MNPSHNSDTPKNRMTRSGKTSAASTKALPERSTRTRGSARRAKSIVTGPPKARRAGPRDAWSERLIACHHGRVHDVVGRFQEQPPIVEGRHEDNVVANPGREHKVSVALQLPLAV